MKNLCVLLLVIVAGWQTLGCLSGETDSTWIEYPSGDARIDAIELPEPIETNEASADVVDAGKD